MKTKLKPILFFVFLAIPLLARQLWYQYSWYRPAAVPDVHDIVVKAPASSFTAVEDEPTQVGSRVVIDLSHDHNLALDDLVPLRDRLAVRGVTVITVGGSYEDKSLSLADALRGATSLVVLAPTISYTSEERLAIVEFVHDGGKLLLGADPTRPLKQEEEEGFLDLYSVMFPTSAVPAINSLANEFGMVYFEDYLYNLSENEGNYRNVRFSQLHQKSELTKGLDSLVFYAAHSLQGAGEPLALGDDNTLSNIRTGETSLSPALLAADGRVVALGDITVVTPLYHLLGDNDRFLANLADWLAETSRQWDVRDFPYLFAGPVDLVQTFQQHIDPALIASSVSLREKFSDAGLTIDYRQKALPEHDVLYMGTYESHAPVKSLVASAGITLTLPLTDAMRTGTDSREEAADLDPSGADDTGSGIIAIAGLGKFIQEGMALFLLDQTVERTTLAILTEDRDALMDAVAILIFSDFQNCLHYESVTLCALDASIGYQDGKEEGDEEPGIDGEHNEIDPDLIVPPGNTTQGKILIFSDDGRPEGERTGADEFMAILQDFYEVTLWVASVDGVPDIADLEGYDVIVVDSGDYAFDDENVELFGVFLSSPANKIFIGEQAFPPFFFTEMPAAIDDLVVQEEDHPIAGGFSNGDILKLAESLSQVPAMVIDSNDDQDENVQVIFSRGPDSEHAGNPAVVAGEDEQGVRIVMAGFAFYRLAPEIQVKFAFNVMEWLLEN
jgi:hypothetical protein